MWHSMKEFHTQLQDALINKEVSQQFQLESQLCRRQSQFTSLLRYPAKSSADRQRLLKADTEPFQLTSISQQVTFPRGVIEEALIISDMLNINESYAVELLLTGEAQQSSFPDLTRGMVAVWLFYDTRRITVDCLRLLLQARRGRMWSLGLSAQMESIISEFLSKIMEDGLLKNILGLLRDLQPHRELSSLLGNKAFASRRHCRQLGNLFMQTRDILAECVMLWACQTPFNFIELSDILGQLPKCLPETSLDPTEPLFGQGELYRIFCGADMPPALTDNSTSFETRPCAGLGLDRAQCFLLMAILYSIDPVGPLGGLTDDLSLLDEMNVSHPLFQNPQSIKNFSQLLKSSRSRRDNSMAGGSLRQSTSSNPGWLSVVRLAWSVQMLHRVVSHGSLPNVSTSSDSVTADIFEFCQREEQTLWNEAVEAGVFNYLLNEVITLPGFMKEVHWKQRIHSLLSDLITFMPLQLKTLRLQNEEALRLPASNQMSPWLPPGSTRDNIHNFIHSVNAAPADLDELHQFESLLLLLCEFYSWPENESFCEEYWSAGDLLDGGNVGDHRSRELFNMSGTNLTPSSRQLSRHGNMNETTTDSDTMMYQRLFRQRCLFRFVRFSADVSQYARLYTAYLKMLFGLSNSQRAASLCFNLLKMNSHSMASQYISMSWDHFFSTFRRYCDVIRNPSVNGAYTEHGMINESISAPNSGFYSHIYGSSQPLSRGIHQTATGSNLAMGSRRYHAAIGCRIKPEELQGMLAVLRILHQVVDKDDAARDMLAQHPTWQPLPLLFDMLSLPFPQVMKSEALRVLAAFSRTSSYALYIWQELSSSEIISYRSVGSKTFQSANVMPHLHTTPYSQQQRPSGLHTEMEELEPLWEEYTLTSSFLALLRTLCVESQTHAYGLLQPTISPAIRWVVEALFLKHHLRAYKRPMERWELACQFVSILLNQLTHFIELYVNMDPTLLSNHPQAQLHGGYFVVTQMLSDTHLFRMMLQLCHQSLQYLQQYNILSQEETKDPILRLAHLVLRCFSLILAHEDSLREVVNNITGTARSLLWNDQGSFDGAAGSMHTTTMSTAPHMLGAAGSTLWTLPASRFSRLLMLSVNPATNQADYLSTIALFTSFAPDYPTLCREALIILKFTVTLIQPHEELIPHLIYNQEVQSQLLWALVQCMENGNAPLFTLEEEYSKDKDAPLPSILPNNCSQLLVWFSSHTRSASFSPSLQCLAVEFLLQCLLLSPSSVFTVGHMMLGFDGVTRLLGAPRQQMATAMKKTLLQEPGMAGASKTCLHALIAILVEEEEDRTLFHDSKADVNVEDGSTCANAYARALCARILHQLCSQESTAEPVLRFLRGTYDFFPKLLLRWSVQQGSLSSEPLDYVPSALLAEHDATEEMTDHRDYWVSKLALVSAFRGWILKCISIELRLVLQLQNRSYALRLLQLLLGSKFTTVGACEKETLLHADIMSRLSGAGEEIPLLFRMFSSLNIRETSATFILESFDPNPHSVIEMYKTFEETLLLGGRFIKIDALLGRLRLDKNGEMLPVNDQMILLCLGAEKYNIHLLLRQGGLQKYVEGLREALEVILRCGVLGLPSSFAAKSFNSTVGLQTTQWPLLAGSTAVTLLCTEYMQLLLDKLLESANATIPSIAFLFSTIALSLCHTVNASCIVTLENVKQVTALHGFTTRVSFQNSMKDENYGAQHQWITTSHLRGLHKLITFVRDMAQLIVMQRNGSQRVRSNLYTCITYIMHVHRSAGDVDPDWNAVSLGGTGGDFPENLLKGWSKSSAMEPKYGEDQGWSSVCSVVYDDICSGHSVTRMSGICFMDCLLTAVENNVHSNVSSWMQWLMRSGNLEDMIHTVLELSRILEKYLRNDQTTEQPSSKKHRELISDGQDYKSPVDIVAPFHLLHGLLALLARIGLSVQGARLLLQCNLPVRLSECGLVSAIPWSREQLPSSPDQQLKSEPMEQGDETEDSSVHWSDLLFGTLRVLSNILTTLGVGHVQAQEQVGMWFTAHQDHLLSIFHNLHSRNVSECIQRSSYPRHALSPASNTSLIKEVLEVGGLIQLMLATESSSLGITGFGMRDEKETILPLLLTVEEMVLNNLTSLVESHILPHMFTSQVSRGLTARHHPVSLTAGDFSSPLILDLLECGQQSSLSIYQVVQLLRCLLMCCIARCQSGMYSSKDNKVSMFSPPLTSSTKSEDTKKMRTQAGSFEPHLYHLMSILHYTVALYRAVMTNGSHLWSTASSLEPISGINAAASSVQSFHKESNNGGDPYGMVENSSGVANNLSLNELRHREEQLRSLWSAVNGLCQGSRDSNKVILTNVPLREMRREFLHFIHCILDSLEMSSYLLWDSLCILLSPILQRKPTHKITKMGMPHLSETLLSRSGNEPHTSNVNKQLQREVISVLGSGWLLEALTEISMEVSANRRTLDVLPLKHNVKGSLRERVQDQSQRPEDDHLLSVMCHNLHRLTVRCEQNMRETTIPSQY